jgi:hypothetical protein
MPATPALPIDEGGLAHAIDRWSTPASQVLVRPVDKVR